jgi:hypothetical protein
VLTGRPIVGDFTLWRRPTASRLAPEGESEPEAGGRPPSTLRELALSGYLATRLAKPVNRMNEVRDPRRPPHRLPLR